MDDATKQRELLARGDKARAIVESELWQDAWKDFEGFIFEQFTKTESRNVELLAHWKRMHVCGLQLRKFFEGAMIDGKFAASNIEFEEQQSRLHKVAKLFK